MASSKVLESKYSTISLVNGNQQPVDDDTRRLADMGYTQELKRSFGIWSVLGTGFSLTNSWFGISTAMVTGINSGGPVLLVYGIILIACISMCIGISLSELASAYPNAGGQYFWTSQLASRKYANFASYLTGWFAYAGSVFASASVALAVGSASVCMWQVLHPEFVIKSWYIVAAYEMFLVLTYAFNCWGHYLPKIAKISLWTSLISFTVILITVPTVAPTHRSAKFVFTTFLNNTGWKNNSVAFIVGLINTNWAFSCLDCATHLAEEVSQPEKTIPIAIIGTVLIGLCTSWTFTVSMMFSIQDLDGVTGSNVLVPILAIFNQAINKIGAVVFGTFIVLTGTGCLIAAQTWQSRLCWSFARDHGLPGHQWLKTINPTTKTPIIAHTVSTIIVGMVGLLYLGSNAAFHAILTACIVLLYVSYAIPILCLLIKGRNNIPHGPFWLGKVGLISNFVLLFWTLFTLIMFSFPVVMPVTASNMNYVSAVYVTICIFIAIDWFVRAKTDYRSKTMEKNRRASSSSSETRPLLQRVV